MTPSTPGDICHLYNSFWKEDSISKINISFWALAPASSSATDILKLIANQDKLLSALFSVGEWTYYEFQYIGSSNCAFGIYSTI